MSCDGVEVAAFAICDLGPARMGSLPIDLNPHPGLELHRSLSTALRSVALPYRASLCISLVKPYLPR